MVFFMNANGTITQVVTEPVYQNSNAANKISLVAPFPKTCMVYCSFNLPNGINTQPRMMYAESVQDVVNKEGDAYNVWSVIIDKVLTEYSGSLTVQFHLSNGILSETETTKYADNIPTYQNGKVIYRSGWKIGRNIRTDWTASSIIYKDQFSAFYGYTKAGSQELLSMVAGKSWNNDGGNVYISPPDDAGMLGFSGVQINGGNYQTEVRYTTNVSGEFSFAMNQFTLVVGAQQVAPQVEFTVYVVNSRGQVRADSGISHIYVTSPNILPVYGRYNAIEQHNEQLLSLESNTYKCDNGDTLVFSFKNGSSTLQCMFDVDVHVSTRSNSFLSTSSTTFEVAKGVPSDLSELDDTDFVDQLLDIVQALRTQVEGMDAAIEGKLDAVYATSDKVRVYAIKADGTQTTLPYLENLKDSGTGLIQVSNQRDLPTGYDPGELSFCANSSIATKENGFSANIAIVQSEGSFGANASNPAAAFSFAAGAGRTSRRTANSAAGGAPTSDGQYAASFNEGYTFAKGAFAEGKGKACGDYSHAEGKSATGVLAYNSTAYVPALYSHAEGQGSTASADSAHGEGFFTHASGNYSHAEGNGTVASGTGAHAEGASSDSKGARAAASHTEGNGCHVAESSSYGHAEGTGTVAAGASHAEGRGTKANGYASHAEGVTSVTAASASHVEGHTCVIVNSNSVGAHSEGYTNTIGNDAVSSIGGHAEGGNNKLYAADYAHVEGLQNIVGIENAEATDMTAVAAHVEGRSNKTYSNYSHVEGLSNTCRNSIGAHVEGHQCYATGANYGHAGGDGSQALSTGAFAHGNSVYAIGDYSVAFGQYNQQLIAEDQIFSIGVGESNDARKNIVTVGKKQIIFGKDITNGIRISLVDDVSGSLTNIISFGNVGEGSYITNTQMYSNSATFRIANITGLNVTNLYLTSPNGTRYKVTVSDSGVLQTTKVD
nr:MAG TPA: hypothetical protein [Caudoviricetes sp.]